MIVGLGKTGLSCARYLGFLGEPFVVADSRPNPPGLEDLRREFPGIECQLGEFMEATFLNARALIVSPGISLKTPQIRTAMENGVPVTGDVDIFSKTIGRPIVAVTGSNGKSTVATLVAEICRQAGVAYGLGGNLDGENACPALDFLRQPTRDIYVLELSSFQLETTERLAAEIAVLLNLSEDHMDRYDSLDEYWQAKQRIFRGARQIVINRDSAFSLPVDPGSARIWEFGVDAPVANGFGLVRQAGKEYLADSGRPLLAVEDLKIFGKHNIANALAAMTIGAALGIETSAIVAAVRNFPGLPHRCQWIADIGGVSCYNDSKGTNVGATLAAVEGLGARLAGKLVLIAGGVGKGADFSSLAPVIAARVRSVVLIGEAGPEIEEILPPDTRRVHARDMQQAVAAALAEAEAGDAVLLSPACASFDMFRDFAHRGQVFAEAVRSLT